MKTFLKLTEKSLKAILVFGLAFTLVHCSKDDGPSSDDKLSLPAILENNTQLIVPDALNVTGTCGSATTPGTGESTIEIRANGIIADPAKVSIEVDIEDTWAGEVVLQLFTPSGDSVGLIKRIGSTSDSSCGPSTDFVAGNKLTFNSTNATLLVGPFVTGNYAPTAGVSAFPTDVPMIPLTTFLTGKNIKGVWKMKVYDCGVGDRVKLNSWKLKFETGALQ